MNLWQKLFGRLPMEYRELFEERRLVDNTGRMFAFSIYIIVLQVSLNILNILRPSDTQSSDIMIYVALSMGTLLIGIIYCVLFFLVRRGTIKSRSFNRFLVESLLYIYTAIQLTFCTLNIISTGGLNSYIIAILIIGLVPIIRPLQSLATILGSFAYILLALYMTRGVSDTWNSILLTDVWTNLIIITALVCCISVFIYTMYLSNFLQSVTLEETVRIRTLELEEQTEAARLASRAKGEFLARMSHEIRTPLNAIMGMTEVARRSADPEKVATSLGEVSVASTHLLGILNDVLDMSKIESGRFEMGHEPFLLRAALEESADIIQLRAREKGVKFTTRMDGVPPLFVNGDKLRLKQVFINLLGNAIKFTEGGRGVEFSVVVRGETATSVTVTFAISDQGIGMTEEQMARLFTAFEQANPSISARYGGTGLGLAISQNLVNRMGGRITVRSQPGMGSEFTFTLTLEKTAGKSTGEVQDFSTHLPDFSDRHVLLVEDIDINRMIITELLSATDVVMDEAENGVEALERFEESPPGYYDMIFMDVQMPVMGGYEATRRIRALDRPDAVTVPIVAMTANAYKEDIEKALESGMNAHLAKPLDINEALHTMVSLLPSRQSS